MNERIQQVPPPLGELNPAQFSGLVLQWFAKHGRKNLPWQRNPSHYRVWISEIMLQQTQVATVIPYFERFMARFADVAQLAAASQDDVLEHWAGLGYYARARNLHRTAQLIVSEHDGVFPNCVDDLVLLPGIGRSTAGAIVSLAGDRSAAILDGNVKRVLCRAAGITGWPGKAAVQKQLWSLTEWLTPATGTGQYNQAMMDLGATLCTRSSPACQRCPLYDCCHARRSGDPTQWPTKKTKSVKRRRQTWMLLVRRPDGGILLQRRPPSGIWGGLWSFPEYASMPALLAAAAEMGQFSDNAVTQWDCVEHAFTHFDLTIQPVLVNLNSTASGAIMDGGEQCWYNGGALPGGQPAPVARLMKIATESMF